jgi:hypothetical protein
MSEFSKSVITTHKYRAWVSMGATGAWHLPKFWKSPPAPADFEVLNTNWHPRSSFYVTSGTLKPWSKVFSIRLCSYHFQTLGLVVQVILIEIDCAIFYTNLHELFCQEFISWTNWVNSGWISCQVMADMEKVYDNLIIINLYIHSIRSYKKRSYKKH